MKSIALIGFGAIAREICMSTRDDPTIHIDQVLVRPGRARAVQDVLPEGTTAIEDLAELSPQVSFVLECAGHNAVRAFGPAVLECGVDFGILSTGALADDSLRQSIHEIAIHHDARAQVIAGAIGGIDALAAAGAALTDVTYLSRKPPISWQGSPAEEVLDLAAIDAPTAVFSGSAREAALKYPKNANVVATVALAGIGFDNTKVTLVADPAAHGNSHQITATGGGYDLKFATRGAALPSNPKTSALTALSALRALRGLAPGLVL